MATTTAFDVDQLAAETVWLRRLARALVADPAAADDVVQDTYLIAATDAPRDGRPLRPWMVRVLWNRIRMRSRSAQRSARRDDAFAKLAEPPATPEAIVDRLVTQRMLTGLVLALEPLYRDVLVLHYFEGLTSTEIGNRLGIAAGTVRWRLKQAIDQLRARLDERQPNRAWVAGIAGLAHGGDAVPFAVSKVVAAAIVGAIALAIIALPGSAASPSPPPRERAAAPALALGARPPHATATDPVPDERPAGAPRHLAGIAIDYDDQPAAGADVTLDCGYVDDPTTSVMRTGADGRFAFDVDPACHPTIWGTRGTTAGIAHDSRHDSGPLRLRLVKQATATIHVVDGDTGLPIANAEVRSLGPFGPADHTRSGADGVAQLRWISWVAHVDVRAAGYAKQRDMLQARARLGADGEPEIVSGFELDHTFRLSHGVPLGGTVIGRDGAPVAHATVTVTNLDIVRKPALSVTSFDHFVDYVTSDDHGHFEIALPAAGAYYTTVSTAPPAPDAAPEQLLDPQVVVPPTGRDGVIVHAPDHRDVRGVVLDATGKPVPGATVAPANGGRRPVVTDAAGRFTLASITEPVDVVARQSGQASAVTHVSSDTRDVTLVIGRAGIGGRVVDANGEPIAHAHVWLNYCCEHAVVMSGRGVTADESGRFVLDGVPSGEFVLSVSGPDDEEFDEANDVHVSSGDRDVRVVVR